jgi:nicotinate-nucleotide pyrophosphorylase (carboxylating)
MTWQEYDTREFDDVEIVFGSIVYMMDVSNIVGFIMRTFVQTGTFGDGLIAAVDAKVAAWQSLLPACKKDPMRQNGVLDEIMFQAHLMAAM